MDLVAFNRIEAKVEDLTNKWESTQDMLQEISNQSYHSLKESNKNLKDLIQRLKGNIMDKVMIISNDGGAGAKAEGPRTKTRANRNKKASETNKEIT